MKIVEEEFKQYLDLKKLSDRSIKEYLLYFNRLFKSEPEEINPKLFLNFLSRNNNDVVRAFINNLVQFILNSEDYSHIKYKFINFQLPKRTGRIERKIPKILDPGEIYSITQHLNNKRNKIMVLVCFYGGLRAEELLNIKPKDFFWKEWLNSKHRIGKLKVKGKGKKERIVLVPATLMKYIQDWINTEVGTSQSINDDLFKIGYRTFYQIFRKATKKALNRKLSPHILRHSSATYLLNKGLSLQEVSDYLGHEKISTTQIYAHLNKAELHNKIEEIF